MTVIGLVRTSKTLWFLVVMVVVVTMEVSSLNGPNVCVVKQKYNITKRVKYRAPMSVRTYEWCFSMPPRCTRWTTEMRDLTKLETEERTAEVSVCCPGYKMKDVSCVPSCPSGKMGPGCSEDCPADKWGPNCVNLCRACVQGVCSPTTGECRCQDRWQGERCEISMSTSTTTTETLLTSSTKPATTATPAEITTKSTIASTASSTAQTKPQTSTASTTAPNVPQTTTHKLSKEAIAPITTTPATITSSMIPTTSEVTKSKPTVKESIVTHGVKHIVQDNNTSLTTPWNTTPYAFVTAKPEPMLYFNNSVYNRTEIPVQTTKSSTVSIKSSKKVETVEPVIQSQKPIPTTEKIIPYQSTSPATKQPETSVKMIPTTIKMKPKEIWIKPAQKGELPIIESKVKISSENLNVKHKSAIREEPSIVTTPRTIIVSIIPTSVSYSTFKKISLTTATSLSQKQTLTRPVNESELGTTKSLASATFAIVKSFNSSNSINNFNATTKAPMIHHSVTESIASTKPSTTTQQAPKNFASKSTHSMMNETKSNLSISDFLTTVAIPSTNVFRNTKLLNTAQRNETKPSKGKITSTTLLPAKTSTVSITAPLSAATVLPSIDDIHNITIETTIKQNVTDKVTNNTDTRLNANKNVMKIYHNNPIKKVTVEGRNKTNVLVLTTEDPKNNEETFHILTEPEHITAVMGERETEHPSVDLLSVISIAGGLMISVITIAVFIVMFDRCKRSSYEDVRKLNDMRMQVMIHNNDVPPPYVRSIFHTPLPDPPSSEKVHYQPISTLDRNLKQFMRPVVVQAISPIMLENFRDILECHYDHLPKRKHENCGAEIRCSGAPSMTCCDELRSLRASVVDSEDLKCDAKMDLLDSTTSEPLYAEIPCWRPPTELPVETVNMNGEAVTEL